MKVLCILLSIYVLYMVSLPCVDEAIDFTKPFAELSGGQNHHNNTHHVDDCSPFCVCACCSVSVDLTVFIFESNPVRHIQSQLIPCYTESISSFFPPIWQPPKIS